MRTLRYADLASLTVLAAPFGYSFVTTVYTQEVRGYSPLQTGLALLPSAVLSALVSRYAAPALIQRCGLRFTAVLGLLLVGAGFLLFLWTGTGTSYVAVPLPSSLVCFGLGMGLAYPVFTVGGVTGVDDERQGLAAGIQQTALQVGGGIGLALVSSGVVANLGEASDPASYVHALHTGVLVGAAIPLLGALTAFLGLKDPAGSPRAIDT